MEVPVRRGIWIVLTMIGVAAVVSAVGILVLYTVLSGGPSVPSQSTLVLRPGGELHEVSPGHVLGPLVDAGGTTVRSYVESLGKAKRDPRVRSVLLIPSAFQTPFWGKLQELRDAVLDFRQSGKMVVAFLEYGGEREYYLASAADQVFLLPTSPLDVSGVATYEIFLRGTLDKLGVYPDFLHIGDYKTAVNQLTEKTFTPAHREMAESLNRDAYEQLVTGIAEGRRKMPSDVRALLDEGPFLPEAALAAGLVDGLAYEDQLDDRVRELRPEEGEVRRVEGNDYRRIDERSVGIRPRSKIAVIYIVGAIASGRGGYDPVNGAIVGSDTLVEQIREIRDDDDIKAIVVRIDSPGGSSTASDVVWRELMITRDERPSRPLVTSMSDLAASGGYYVALPGQVIVAEPGTWTGSIGIYTGKMVVAGTLDKLGVNMQPLTSGRNAAIQSPLTPYTQEQRAKIDAVMRAFYTQFVEKVAISRRMTVEQVEAVAQGRVWTGAQAKARGLVDALGGLATAVRVAKERARIPADEDVELIAYPPRRGLYELFVEQFGGSRVRFGALGLLRAMLGHSGPAPLTPTQIFRRGEPLALMPFVAFP